MSSFNAVILAAGEGKRMKTTLAKALHEICFKPMLEIIADTAREAGANRVCVVTGHGREQIEARIRSCEFAYQKERLGTGHAVMSARGFIEDNGGDVLVIPGDAPLMRAQTLLKAYEFHKNENADLTVITAEVKEPAGLGRIIRGGDGALDAIVEKRDCTEEQLKICEINSGAYFFKTDYLINVLGMLKTDNDQGEYYLTDTVKYAGIIGARARAFTAGDPLEALGVNDRAELAAADRILRLRINGAHMLGGVTIIDPEATYISPDVTIGADTVIYPGCVLRGKTTVGAGCTLLSGCFITDSTIGDGVTAGPFAQLRPHSEIASGVKIGDFVEIKNSIIGKNTKIPHLSYVGDSDVGENVNIGCGVVTVNYDGKVKSRTDIRDGAFIGCNTNLIAPVKIGRNAYTAAGSTITENVPDGALAIARERQTNKEGWVARRRDK